MARHEHRAPFGTEAPQQLADLADARPGRDRWRVRRARATPGPSATRPRGRAAASCRASSGAPCRRRVREPDELEHRRRRASAGMRSIAPRSRRFSRPVIVGNNAGVSTIAPIRGITVPRRSGVGLAEDRRRAPRSVAPVRAGTGSSSSCPTRSDRGSRTRRLRATARSRPATAVVVFPRKRRYSLRSPSISMTVCYQRAPPRVECCCLCILTTGGARACNRLACGFRERTRLPGLRRRQPLLRGARRLHPPPRPEARAALRAVGRDQRPQVPRGRRAGEPRGREPDVRPDRQGRRDARLLPRQPRRQAAARVPASSASRSRPSTATATPASPSSTSSASRRCGCSRRSACSTRSCSSTTSSAVTLTFTAFNRWLDEDWGCNYQRPDLRRAVHLARATSTGRSRELEWALDRGARAIVMRPAAPHTADGQIAGERPACSIRSGRA